jgi:hypothetical protein
LAPVYGWFKEGFDTRDLKERRRCRTSWPRESIGPSGDFRKWHIGDLARCPFRVCYTPANGHLSSGYGTGHNNLYLYRPKPADAEQSVD